MMVAVSFIVKRRIVLRFLILIYANNTNSNTNTYTNTYTNTNTNSVLILMLNHTVNGYL